MTDKHITEHYRFLSYILPGDVVLADRGLDIQYIVGSQCAEVKIPAFTRGKDQLSPLEIEMTRKIANYEGPFVSLKRRAHWSDWSIAPQN